MQFRLGNGPDSWGVWFPQDTDQVQRDQFLDDVAAAGYRYMELGPTGTCRPTSTGSVASSRGATCTRSRPSSRRRSKTPIATRRSRSG